MSTPTPEAVVEKSTANIASPNSKVVGDSTSTKQALRCPRCDSSNTKFCYYNNYSLSQPRHFCKTCRRYWTQGGALRNVPVGGGCRKNNKKLLKSSTPMDNFTIPYGGTTSPFPVSNHHRFAMEPASLLTMGFMGPNLQEMGGQVVHQSSNLASSIESLSCINQDMHWKLQQQRLSVFFATDHHTHNKQPTTVVPPRVSIPTQMQEPNPIHQVYPSSSASESRGREEWLFVNSGSSVNPNLTAGGFGQDPNWSNGVEAQWTSNLP